MKKIIAVLLSVAVLFAFAACDNSTTNPYFGKQVQSVTLQSSPDYLVGETVNPADIALRVVYTDNTTATIYGDQVGLTREDGFKIVEADATTGSVSFDFTYGSYNALSDKAGKPMPWTIAVPAYKIEGVKVDVAWVTKYVGNVKTQYIVTPEGKVEAKLKCKNIIPLDMPRYGLTFELQKGIDGVKYYGKGPHENYCDRKTGAYLGVYTFDKCEDFIHDYLYPQENGNRCDVRWLEVGKNIVLRVDAVDKPFEAGVHPYTLKELDEADHSCYLPRRDTLTVNIDGGQHGVGGDVPAVATLKPQYKLPKYKDLEFTCCISFIKK